MAASLCALLLLGSVNSFNVRSHISGPRAFSSRRQSGFVTDSNGVIVGLAENDAVAVPILADEVELTKLFGRFAENRILLDVPGAGTPEMINCCHGGCDNCDFSQSFDEMKAGRPKWVPNYLFLEHIDGRSHTPAWVDTIFNGATGSVTEADFVERVRGLEYKACLGPMKSVQADDPPSEEACRALFQAMSGSSADESSELTAEQMATALRTSTGEEFGAMWRDFKTAFSS